MADLLQRFARDRSGVAAAEMTLSIPLLLVLMLGCFELGAYFWAEHIVIKAVRDGARYAARQPYSEYPSCTPSALVVDSTRNLTRTGQVASGGTPRIESWSSPASITVAAECDTSGAYTGVYVASPIGAPVVTVAASVPFTPLFSSLGLADVTLSLNARSEATVYGL